MKQKLFFITVLLLAMTVQAATLRVSPTGNNSDGSSWANAYTSIQAALTAAAAGDKIWVQQSTYMIMAEAEQLNFKEEVNVYGGFVGNETTLAQRNTNPELTTISHDVNGVGKFRLLTSSALNAATTWDGFTFDGKKVGSGVYLNSNCNLNNVVVKNGFVSGESGAGVNIGSSTKIFGTVNLTNSTIKDNTISVTGVPYLGGGAGVFVSQFSTAALIENCIISGNTINAVSTAASVFVFGAGVLIHEGVIKNSTIDSNNVIGTAANNYITGGGIAIRPMNAEREVLIEGCSVTNNTSKARGGAIIIDPVYSGQYLGKYTISHTKIINNKSTDAGGGIFTTSSTKQNPGWTLNVINSVIANNTAVTGGGIFINSSGAVNITYATIVNNVTTSTFGGGGINFQGAANQTINAAITNTLIWNNTQTGTDNGRTQFNNNKQAAAITYSAIQDYNASYAGWDNTTRQNIINLNSDNANATGPMFLAPTTTIGYGVSDVDASRWQITSKSILIQAGTDANDQDGKSIVSDYMGTARPNSSVDFMYPDVGAYQFDAANPPVLGLENVAVKVSGFIIYPTVTNSLLNIETSKSIKNIEVYNLNGNTVLKSKATKVIDVSNLSSGMYLFKAIFDDNIVEVKRFIKQ